jgi:hypothetical protein
MRTDKWAATNQNDTVNFMTYVGSDADAFCNNKAIQTQENRLDTVPGSLLQRNNPELVSTDIIKCQQLQAFENLLLNNSTNHVCQIITSPPPDLRAKYQTINIDSVADIAKCANPWKRIPTTVSAVVTLEQAK